jgi:hypothetical protein
MLLAFCFALLIVFSNSFLRYGSWFSAPSVSPIVEFSCDIFVSLAAVAGQTPSPRKVGAPILFAGGILVQTGWHSFTYPGKLHRRRCFYDSVSGDTEDSTWFFQEGNTFPEEPRFSPSSHPGSVGFSIRESLVRSTWVTRRRGWLGSRPWLYLSKPDTVSSRWLLPWMLWIRGGASIWNKCHNNWTKVKNNRNQTDQHQDSLIVFYQYHRCLQKSTRIH